MMQIKPTYKKAVMKLICCPSLPQALQMLMCLWTQSPLMPLSLTPVLKVEETLTAEVTMDTKEEANNLLVEVLRAMSTSISLLSHPRHSP